MAERATSELIRSVVGMIEGEVGAIGRLTVGVGSQQDRPGVVSLERGGLVIMGPIVDQADEATASGQHTVTTPHLFEPGLAVVRHSYANPENEWLGPDADGTIDGTSAYVFFPVGNGITIDDWYVYNTSGFTAYDHNASRYVYDLGRSPQLTLASELVAVQGLIGVAHARYNDSGQVDANRASGIMS